MYILYHKEKSYLKPNIPCFPIVFHLILNIAIDLDILVIGLPGQGDGARLFADLLNLRGLRWGIRFRSEGSSINNVTILKEGERESIIRTK